MERNKFFWRLGSVAKFDYKRFASDAEKIKIRKPKPTDEKQPAQAAQPHANTADKQTTTKAQAKKRKRDELSGKAPKSTEEIQNTKQEAVPVGEGQTPIANGVVVRKKLTKKQKSRRNAKQKKLASKSKEELAQMVEEENRIMRKKYRIKVHGTDVPAPLKTFSQLQSDFDMKDEIIRNVRDEGYNEPTPIQRQIIPAMLEGRDVMACAPTGSGKTAAFIIPILHHLKEPSDDGFRACILAPTRELAQQILRECTKLSKGFGLRSRYIQEEKDASKKFDILITTPNRLIYMLQSSPPALSVEHVEWLIVDESDKLFESGTRGFRDQLGAIYTACSSSKLHRGMFSATFAQDVDEWCKLNLDNVVQVDVGQRNTATSSVEQKLVYTGDEAGKLLAFRNIVHEGISPPVLVFVQSKERAQHLYVELKYDNINVDVVHSDRSLAERDEVIKSFRLGQTWVLICTELMSRGIDFKGVNMVINYDFPTSAISYIHRVGRTGRAGRQGKAVTFFTQIDKVLLRRIATVVRQAGCHVSEYMIKGIKEDKKRIQKRYLPEREKILTMDPRDYTRMKRKSTDPRDRIRKKPVDPSGKSDKKQTGAKGGPLKKKKMDSKGKGTVNGKTTDSKNQSKGKTIVDSKKQIKDKAMDLKKQYKNKPADTKKQLKRKHIDSKKQLNGNGKPTGPKERLKGKRKLMEAGSKPQAKRRKKN